MANNRLSQLKSVKLSGTTKQWADDLNDNFAELDERQTDNEAALEGKVDKVTDKGLSTNDYTNEEKSKLNGIAEGAEPNVQSDWNQSDNTQDDYIKNKPTLGTAASKNTGTGAGNVPVLDSNGKLDTNILPAVAITDTFVVNSQASMLALVAEKGDIAIRTDLNKSFVLQAEPASTLTNWKELLTPPSAVLSVNGKTGAVVLVATDVGALPDTIKYAASLSVNGRSIQLKDQDGNNLGSPIQTQDTTYSPATQSANGLMSSSDKTKLDGVSIGANKVEASQVNGNIKIDGVETKVFKMPTVDQVKPFTFTAADSRWGALTDGVYTLTINSNTTGYVSGLRPFICFNASGAQVMATLAYTSSNITIKAEEKFAGTVLAI